MSEGFEPRQEPSGVHWMVDIEGLGDPRTGNGVVLSIGACRFGMLGIEATFYRSIDVWDSIMEGMTIEDDVVEWWRKQSPTARGAAQPEKGRVTLRQALGEFSNVIKKTQYVWAKGPDYDLVMLEGAYRTIGQPIPWSWRLSRDYRTIAWLAGLEKPVEPPVVKHHALKDAISQAQDVRECMARLLRPWS